MNMNLKFTDEAAAKAVLCRIEGAVEADPEQGIEAQEGYEVANYRNIDTIGVIYEGGAWDAEGNQITAPVALEGWHINVFVLPDEDASVLQAHQVFPATPVRTWA